MQAKFRSLDLLVVLDASAFSAERAWSFIAVSKSSLTSPDADTPIRRPADTLPQLDGYQRSDLIHA